MIFTDQAVKNGVIDLMSEYEHDVIIINCAKTSHLKIINVHNIEALVFKGPNIASVEFPDDIIVGNALIDCPNLPSLEGLPKKISDGITLTIKNGANFSSIHKHFVYIYGALHFMMKDASGIINVLQIDHPPFSIGGTIFKSKTSINAFNNILGTFKPGYSDVLNNAVELMLEIDEEDVGLFGLLHGYF